MTCMYNKLIQELLSPIPPHSIQLGFPIAIPLHATLRNCAQGCGFNATVFELRTIVRNCAELRGIVGSSQGSQLRANKIHFHWKPYLHYMRTQFFPNKVKNKF